MTEITGAWLHNAATVQVMKVLNDAGAKAYFVGGCVRNALLDLPISDIDISTDALPETVIKLAEAAGLRAVPTGLDHGTVTLVVSGKPFEVTTFRKDIETDGRRAVVAFSKDIKDDAGRRDFTMNALYADASGKVLDPLNGLPDLRARRVRFIDDAQARIKEDYLRSLRFFRFHAHYGEVDAGMDREALAAIAANLDGLASLSKERIGSEVLKLLTAQNPAPSTAAMAQSGVLARILPGADCTYLAPLIHFEGTAAPDPIRRLAILGGHDPAQALRLSRKDAKQLDLLRTQIGQPNTVTQNGYRFGATAAIDIELLRSALFEQPPSADFMKAAARGATQVFPVRAEDLMHDLQGPALGKRLRELEKIWMRSDFALTKEQLLSGATG